MLERGSPTPHSLGCRALAVEVTQGGQLRSGIRVGFQSLPGANPAPVFLPISLYDPKAAVFTDVVGTTTNGAGTASVLVRLGHDVGEARVLVTCPDLGLSDTAQFTVLPGNVAQFALSVRDTSVRAGASYTITASVFDQSGNPRADSITFEAGPNVAAVDARGRVTVGSQVGRGAVAVRAGAFVDSARFVVVPDLTVALVRPTSATTYSIATAELDGSNVRDLASVSTPAYPIYSPDGSLIAYEQGVYDGPWSILLTDSTGSTRPLVNPDSMPVAQYPHFTGDGQTIYFSGKATGDLTFSVWRVRVDGTGLTRVATTSQLSGDVYIGVAPDGSRIAYTENSITNLVDLATGAVVVLRNRATFLEFSPDSRRLATLLSTGIEIVNLGGGPPLEAASGRVRNDAGLSWSPDGRWIVIRGSDGPMLVDATTGEAMLLFLPAFYQMSVRP